MIPPNIIYYTCSRIQYGLYAIYSRDLIVKLAYCCFQFFQMCHFSKSTLSNTGEKKNSQKDSLLDMREHRKRFLLNIRE